MMLSDPTFPIAISFYAGNEGMELRSGQRTSVAPSPSDTSLIN